MISLFRHSAPDEMAFRNLVRNYQQPLYWHIRRIVGCHEDAEDALQETFIRAYRHRQQLREDSAQKAWLYQIATREALRLVEQRRQDEVPIDEAVQVTGDSPTDAEALQQALQQAIAKLPPRQRAVFCMRYYEDMSYEDIAQATDSNVKAVTANYHHAKERIRQYLLTL